MHIWIREREALGKVPLARFYEREREDEWDGVVGEERAGYEV